MIITEIKEVSLYRSGAYITRIGNVDLHAGKQTITIEGLTSTLEPSTLSVGLSDKVKGSNIRVEQLSAEDAKERKKELQSKLERIRKAIEVRNVQIDVLQGNTDFTSSDKLDLKDMADYIDALPERIEKIYRQIQDLKDEEAELAKQLKEKEKQLNAYLVKVDLETESDGSYPIQLRYYEYAASWNPFYEIHTTQDDQVSIRLKGKVRQNSIEDWKGVSLKLFTGNPSLSADIPQLSPWRLNFYAPPRNAYAGMGMMAARSAMPMEDTMEMVADEEVMEEAVSFKSVVNDAAEVSQSDTMMIYDISGTYDIDHLNERSIDLTSRNVPCRYHVVAVPKQDNYGYLAAEVKTADIEELIDTNANIYHQENYLGNIRLSVDPSKETYDISLGKDESIRLKRDQKKRYRSNVLLKGQTKMEFEYEISITSNKKEDFDVTLIDQIPVSQDKTIVVDAQELSAGKLNEETGEVKWELHLEPSSTKTIKLAYSISWPKDKELRV